MTRMTGPDCAVMYSLINTHTHTHLSVPASGPSSSRPPNLMMIQMESLEKRLKASNEAKSRLAREKKSLSEKASRIEGENRKKGLATVVAKKPTPGPIYK